MDQAQSLTGVRKKTHFYAHSDGKQSTRQTLPLPIAQTKPCSLHSAEDRELFFDSSSASSLPKPIEITVQSNGHAFEKPQLKNSARPITLVGVETAWRAAPDPVATALSARREVPETVNCDRTNQKIIP